MDADHAVLVAGRNFGCGSSRTHAPRALLNLGVCAVVSSKIADVFTTNALKNGLLPVVVDAAYLADLLSRPDQPVTIDREAGELTYGDDVASVTVKPFAPRCLLDGADRFGFLLARTDAVAA